MTRPRLTLLALAAALVLTATAFAPAPPTDAPPGAGAQELIQPQPSWYTDALHERVVDAAAEGQGVPVPDGIELPTSGLLFTGIRPGAWMVSPAGCTLNFVFGSLPDDSSQATAAEQRAVPPPDRDNGNNGNGKGNGKGGGDGVYIGTAGHCTEVGDEVTIVALPGVLMNIGTTVKSVDNGIGDDFALIEIRPEMVQHVNPSTAYFGGPTATGDPQLGDVVEHTGHGLVVGTGGTPRAGVTVYRGDGESSQSDAFAWDGVATPGDSGSPVLELDGTAAGDLTHIVVGGPYVPGVIAGTSIQRMLEIAGQPLATAPIGPDPTS